MLGKFIKLLLYLIKCFSQLLGKDNLRMLKNVLLNL